MGRRVGKRGEKVGPRKRAEVRGKGEGEVGRAGFDWAGILGCAGFALGWFTGLWVFFSFSILFLKQTNKVFKPHSNN